MKIGKELLYGTLKEKQSFSEETFNNSIKEATKKFYAEEDELIKTLPVTYYTRRKEQLISFIYDSIRAGVSFSLEVVTYLNADSNKELEMLQNCSV